MKIGTVLSRAERYSCNESYGLERDDDGSLVDIEEIEYLLNLKKIEIRKNKKRISIFINDKEKEDLLFHRSYEKISVLTGRLILWMKARKILDKSFAGSILDIKNEMEKEGVEFIFWEKMV